VTTEDGYTERSVLTRHLESALHRFRCGDLTEDEDRLIREFVITWQERPWPKWRQ
jgi:hypothetical protein